MCYRTSPLALGSEEHLLSEPGRRAWEACCMLICMWDWLYVVKVIDDEIPCSAR